MSLAFADEDQKILDDITEYYESHNIREMLKEYLKRLIIHQPADPLAFLQKQIKLDPVQVCARQESESSFSKEPLGSEE